MSFIFEKRALQTVKQKQIMGRRREPEASAQFNLGCTKSAGVGVETEIEVHIKDWILTA